MWHYNDTPGVEVVQASSASTILRHLGPLRTEYSSVMWHHNDTPGVEVVQASTLCWYRLCAELPAKLHCFYNKSDIFVILTIICDSL